MIEFTAFLAATLVTVPLIGLYIIYFVSVKTTRNKQVSFKIAVDSTVLLFIISVYFLFLEIWRIHTGWMIVLFFLFTALIFTVLHWKNYEDIKLRRLFKGVWRFQFVVFFILYFILVIYGMIFRIIA
jgi:hypothetical protein